jgi:AcrR family transcriptional regulator
MKSTNSLEEQWKEARREQILEAAGRVFSERGYHMTKMKDVADAAGVSNGTVYNYFASKEEVLQALLSRLNETEKRSEHFAQGLEATSFRDFFRGYLRYRMEFLQANLGTLKALLPELMVHPNLQGEYHKNVLSPSFVLAESFLRNLADTGEMKAFNPELLARVLAGSVFGLLLLQLLGDEVLAQKHGEAVELLGDVLCDGLLLSKEDSSLGEKEAQT